MRLIIGGTGQGKLDFAVNKYGINPDEAVDGEEFDMNDLTHISCIYNYHLTVGRLLEKGENPIDFTKKILAGKSDIIIIMNEIGNGIVPLEKKERIFREQVGRTGCFLAENAVTVERIVCGIAVKIKG